MVRLVGFVALAFAILGGPAAAKDAAFEIYRKGEPIGVHRVSVETVGDETIATTEIDMRVGFGPITLYRYKHRSREVWRDGAVWSIESTTNDNGDDMYLSLVREGDVLKVDGSAYQGEAPLDAVPSSYWNDAILDCRTLINTQNGELIDVEVREIGARPARLANGETFTASKYQLSGTVDLHLWYLDQHWTGAAFSIKGEELTYAFKAGEAELERFAALDDED